MPTVTHNSLSRKHGTNWHSLLHDTCCWHDLYQYCCSGSFVLSVTPVQIYPFLVLHSNTEQHKNLFFLPTSPLTGTTSLSDDQLKALIHPKYHLTHTRVPPPVESGPKIWSCDVQDQGQDIQTEVQMHYSGQHFSSGYLILVSYIGTRQSRLPVFGNK